MNPDDPVCLCFHVTRRKVIGFIRSQQPRKPSQLSECFGAGTGCGWCRPYLERLHRQYGPDADQNISNGLDELTLEEYQQQRAEYRKRS